MPFPLLAEDQPAVVNYLLAAIGTLSAVVLSLFLLLQKAQATKQADEKEQADKDREAEIERTVNLTVALNSAASALTKSAEATETYADALDRLSARIDAAFERGRRSP